MPWPIPIPAVPRRDLSALSAMPRIWAYSRTDTLYVDCAGHSLRKVRTISLGRQRLASRVVGNFDDELPEVLPLEEPKERVRRVLDAVDELLPVLEVPFG